MKLAVASPNVVSRAMELLSIDPIVVLWAPVLARFYGDEKSKALPLCGVESIEHSLLLTLITVLLLMASSRSDYSMMKEEPSWTLATSEPFSLSAGMMKDMEPKLDSS